MRSESDYYIWLFELVGSNYSYTKLIKHLDTITYTWALTLDANRAAGGINLRERYSYEASVDSEEVRSGPCTVLEMLIGVADHMIDQLGEDIYTWFWVMMHNLNLHMYDDKHYNAKEVEKVIQTWLNREYDKDGTGSIFPLKNYPGDCRFIEVWAQMNIWITENYPEDGSWLN